MIHKRLIDAGIAVPAHTVTTASGQTSVCCPQCSATRRKPWMRCLSVNVRRGLWLCHHCGWKTPSLKAGTRKIDRHPLKIQDSGRWPATQRVKVPAQREVTALGATWRKYLAGRGIDPDFAQAHGVGQARVYNLARGQREAALCFEFTRKGVVRNRKFRFAGKQFQLEGGCERLLWGVDALGPTTVIVEGEIDRLACLQAGIKHVVSVPDGAPSVHSRDLVAKLGFLNGDALRLSKVQRFVLAVDDDGPGRRLAQALAARLGPHLCVMIGGGAQPSYPGQRKDAGNVLQDLGAAALKAHFEATIEQANLREDDGQHHGQPSVEHGADTRRPAPGTGHGQPGPRPLDKRA